jgi:hypothetical protein
MEPGEHTTSPGGAMDHYSTPAAVGDVLCAEDPTDLAPGLPRLRALSAKGSAMGSPSPPLTRLTS